MYYFVVTPKHFLNHMSNIFAIGNIVHYGDHKNVFNNKDSYVVKLCCDICLKQSQ